jgi:hypothetical protein
VRPRNTALLLLLALLLGGFIYLYETGDETRSETPTESPGLIFSWLSADDIEFVQMATEDGQVAELERVGDGWRLLEPVHFPADDVTMEGIASQLAQLEIAGRVEGGGLAADFGLADEARILRFRTGSGEGGLRIGRSTPLGSNTYVAWEGSDEVVYVATWRVNALRKTLTELRNRQVLEFDSSAVERISVSWPGTRVELEQRDGGWWMTLPVSEPADAGTVETMLSDLSFLRADDFIDTVAPTPADLGLEIPELHVVLHGPDWNRGMMLGRVIEGRRVVRGTGGALFSVAPERLDDYPRELIAWRAKDLARFVVADARSFELAFAATGSVDPGESGGETRVVRGTLRGGEWTIGPEPMDPGKARRMLRVLSRLEATEIVAEEMGEGERAALGLAPPRLAVRVVGEGDRPLAELGFGVRVPGRGPLAMRLDGPHVYRIAEEDGGTLPADWADFQTSFRPETEAGEGAAHDGPREVEEDGPAEGSAIPDLVEETSAPVP